VLRETREERERERERERELVNVYVRGAYGIKQEVHHQHNRSQRAQQQHSATMMMRMTAMMKRGDTSAQVRRE